MTSSLTGVALDEAALTDLMAGRRNPFMGGADRAGLTAADSQFQTAQQRVISSRYADGSGKVGAVMDEPATESIYLPPGTYRITQPKMLLGAISQTDGIQNFHVWSEGPCTLLFDPGSAQIMMENTRFRKVRFSNITFVCSAASAGSTFYHGLNSSGSASQDGYFHNCQWSGPWDALFSLEGDDNNSEFCWHNCDGYVQDGGAWLRTRAATGTDQFLNYHWSGITKWWSNNGALIDAEVGGHFVVEHLDASAWGKGGTGTLFNLKGTMHAWGVQSCDVRHLRVEDFGANTRILYCSWAGGNVSFRQVDQSSQMDSHMASGSSPYGSKWVIDLNGDGNSHPGPVFHLADSHLAGNLEVVVNAGANQFIGTANATILHVSDSAWIDRTSSNVVVYSGPSAGQTANEPPVTFDRVRWE